MEIRSHGEMIIYIKTDPKLTQNDFCKVNQAVYNYLIAILELHR